jgi:type IV pilus assembly protein PilB
MPRDIGFLIGEKLIQKGVLTTVKLKDAIEKQKLSGRLLGEVLTELGYASEEQVAQAVSEQISIPYIDITRQQVKKNVLEIIPESMARDNLIFPLFKMDNSITVAMKDPLNIRIIDRLKHITHCDIDPVISTRMAILKMIDSHYGVMGSLDQVVRDIKVQELSKTKGRPARKASEGKAAGLAPDSQQASDQIEEAVAEAAQASVITLVNSIFKQAVDNASSDIHLEPEEGEFHLRYRIDGVLYDMPLLPKDLEAAVISRIKIMSNMDIAEKRLPQDGNIQLNLANLQIDMRVSTFPTIHGENISIRVLNRETMSYSMEEIGLEQFQLEKLEGLVSRPNGIILVTGPTGCGKTTTLYAILNKINSLDKNIITLEDPVEYRIARLRQSEIDIKAGLTFANGLRSILRQDPDIIFIGEIRDLETAEIAIRAALTGHLVLSSLHTNDAASAMNRLLDMGIEPFLVSSSVIGVVAQRLVRKVCPKCKQDYHAPKEVLKSLNLSGPEKGFKFNKGKGCDSCRDTGYKGRTATFELFEVNESIKKLVLAKASASELKKEAIKEGMMTLRQTAVKKLETGLTTDKEVFRCTDKDMLE